MPLEVIAFTELKPGDRIAELLPDIGDFTRIFCELVGAAGHVYAITAPASSIAKDAHAKLAEESTDLACTNVTAFTLQPRNFPAPELYNSSDDPGTVYEYFTQRLPIESFVAPEPLDLIWVAGNYHDLRTKRFGSPNMTWVNSAFLKALKSGGVLIVEDYATTAESGARDTGTLHRIDPQQVKAEVIAAGFEFVAESKATYGADESQTPNIRGPHDKTDRFLFKFRKP